MWRLSIVTLYPDLFPGTLGASIIGKGAEKGLWSLDVHNIRSYATDKHQTVDDSPFGGGAGMVMRPDVLDACLHAVAERNPFDRLLVTSARGVSLTQERAENLVKDKHVGIICGRFEGIDQRVLDKWKVTEISIGDYVLAGGEVAAMVIAESCIRLLPNVMNSGNSLMEESFTNGLLEYPQFTRPQEWSGRGVPDVLVSGHHENVRKWRCAESEKITRERRPDLWQAYLAKKKTEEKR
ncbi:MAG: tRNA (guanosine(37)-N1)-methyltransferase TrmD [Alphaproteobacteria bacterium]|nr:MAG: tRNA (guanosine(37)-N1)-methyltransferase TrmD [Alphaproteobacteria bacterium]